MTFSVTSTNVIPGFLFGSRSPFVVLRLAGDAQSSSHFASSLKRTLKRIASPEIKEWPALLTSDLSIEDLLSATIIFASIECDELVKGAINHSELPRPLVNEHQIKVWIPITQPHFAKRVANIVLSVLNTGATRDALLLDTSIESLKQQLSAKPPKPPERSITNQPLLLKAAYDLGIPVFQLNEFHAVLGYGNQLRHYRSTLTDETSALGREIAQSKFRTAQYLRTLSLPAPPQFIPLNAEQAVAHAERLGRPVVIKPDHLDRGTGVHTNLVEREAVAAAFNNVNAMTHRVVMEPHLQGYAHRLTVHRGKVIKVVRRTPGGVLGDGIHSINELLEVRARDKAVQEKARRHSQYLSSLDSLAREMLAKQGFKVDYIPQVGEFIRLRPTDNLSTGGQNTLLDIALDVHAENISIAIRASEALKLDFAGIDILSNDLGVAWYENDAVIGEVNVVPQLGTGTTPEVYRDILELTLPNKGIINIEVVIDKAENHPQITMPGRSKSAGLSSNTGAWVDGQCIAKPVANSFAAARALLMHPEVETAVCYMTPKEALAFGLPALQCTKITVVGLGKNERPPLEIALSQHTELLTFS